MSGWRAQRCPPDATLTRQISDELQMHLQVSVSFSFPLLSSPLLSSLVDAVSWLMLCQLLLTVEKKKAIVDCGALINELILN